MTVEVLSTPGIRFFALRAELEADGFAVVHVGGYPFPYQVACEAAALSGVGYGIRRRDIEGFTVVVRRLEGRLDTFDLDAVAVAAARATWDAMAWAEPVDSNEQEREWPPVLAANDK